MKFTKLKIQFFSEKNMVVKHLLILLYPVPFEIYTTRYEHLRVILTLPTIYTHAYNKKLFSLHICISADTQTSICYHLSKQVKAAIGISSSSEW